MKRIVLVLLALFLTTACAANDNQGQQAQQDQLGQQTKTRVQNNSNNHFNKMVSRNGQRDIGMNDVGFNIQKVSSKEIRKEEIVPSEPDMEREDKVLRIVDETEKYIGKKMGAKQFVTKVFDAAGYKGVVMDSVPAKNTATADQDLTLKMQPGDILYLDLDGDGKADHHAIKLGNGDIIHAVNGIVTVTDILKDTKWKKQIIHVQRVF